MQRVFFVLAILMGVAVSAESAAQCQQGGRGGQSSQSPGLMTQTAFSNPQFGQQLYQQAAAQHAYTRQLQMQRAMLYQQVALQRAQDREASRQRRLAAATARREKDAKRRSEQRQQTSLAALSN